MKGFMKLGGCWIIDDSIILLGRGHGGGGGRDVRHVSRITNCHRSYDDLNYSFKLDVE